MARHRASGEEASDEGQEPEPSQEPAKEEPAPPPAEGEPEPAEAAAEPPAPPKVYSREEAQALDIAGTYRFLGTGQASTHRDLGELVPGETYEYTNDLPPEGKLSVQAMVNAKQFEKVS